MVFILALIGYFMNGTNRYKPQSYMVWLVSNGSWALIAFISGQSILGWMFVSYNIFCLYNLVKTIKTNRKMSSGNRFKKTNIVSLPKVKTFEDKMKEWNSLPFIAKLMGVEIKFVNNDDNRVKHYRKQLSRLTDKQYKMIGYGSLIGTADAGRTVSEYYEFEAGYISGWERVFDMGNSYSGSYLNIRKNTRAKPMLVSVITIDVDQMPKIIMREINYNVIDTKVTVNGVEVDAVMVEGSAGKGNALEPQLNYLHLCLQGAMEIAGLSGRENFLDTTYTYRGTLREWFNKTDLLSVMSTQSYLSR